MQCFLIRLALQDVFKKRLRAFLTIGGVAASTAVMVVLFGLGAGLQNMVTQQISKASLRDVITVDSKNTKIIRINQATVNKFQSISGVSSVEEIINLSGQVTYNGISLIVPVYGVSANYFNLSPVATLAGNTAGRNNPDERTIILSQAALKAFGADKSLVGKKVSLDLTITQDIDNTQAEMSRQVTAKDFVVKAVIDKGSSPVAYVPAAFLYKQGVNNNSQAKVQVAYPEKIVPIRESIEQLGYQTSNIQDAIDQVNRIFKIIRGILIVFALITVLVTVIGTVNTITIDLVEETRQIGFLRILGIRASDVGRLFIMQSVILSVSGVLIGIVLGVLVGSLTNLMVQAVANQGAIGGEAGIYAYEIPFGQIIIMLMLSIILGWAIGWLPAKRAVKINPLEALRA